MNSQENTRTYKSGELMKRFLPYYKKYWKIVVIDLLCAGLTTICELVLPMIIRYITNAGMNDLTSLTASVIIRLGVLYLCLRVVDTVANFYMAYTGHVMGTRIETDMRRDAYAHLQKLSDTYYNNTKVGQIMGRITNDLFDVTEFAHHCPEEFFLAGVKIVTSFVILSTFDIYLTLIIFAFIPITIALGLHFRKKMRAAYTKNRHQRGEINADVEDSLLGVRVVKSFARESYEEEKFAKGNEKFLDIKKETYKYMASFASVTRMCEGIMYVAVIFFG